MIYFATLFITLIFGVAGCDYNKENNIYETNVCYIKWAVPDDSIKIQDEWVLKINDRLMSEGYSIYGI